MTGRDVPVLGLTRSLHGIEQKKLCVRRVIPMSSILTLAAFSFWAWMVYDCAKREKEKTSWCLI